MNKKKYFVEGMHCPSCELYVESQFKDIKGIKGIKADNSTQTVILDIEDSLNTEQIIEDINKKMEGSGYKIKTEIEKRESNTNNLPLAFTLALILLLLFLFIQKLTIGESLFSKELSFPIIFMLGILASLSSCMAVVGSLVLSMSSVYAKEKVGLKPMIFFHIARIVGFFLLGGVLGLLGSLFILSRSIEIGIGIILFVVMLILGLNLLDISSFFRKIEFTLPKTLSKGLFVKNNISKTFTPILLGAGTFFLPCGFTQAMQLNSVLSGDFLQGGLIMLVFVLGTFPVLFLISLGSKKIAESTNSDLFLKISGFLVIFFAIYNLLGVLIANGVIPPIF